MAAWSLQANGATTPSSGVGRPPSSPSSAAAATHPLYRIEKRPALQTRQGQWAVIGEGGVILKRGRELPQVLRVFDSRKFQVVE